MDRNTFDGLRIVPRLDIGSLADDDNDDYVQPTHTSSSDSESSSLSEEEFEADVHMSKDGTEWSLVPPARHTLLDLRNPINTAPHHILVYHVLFHHPCYY